MGFFSKLAKKLIDKSDDVAKRVISEATGIPLEGNKAEYDPATGDHVFEGHRIPDIAPPPPGGYPPGHPRNPGPVALGADSSAAVPPPRPISTEPPVVVPPGPAVPPPHMNVPIAEPPPVPMPNYIGEMERVSASMPQPSMKNAYVRNDGEIRNETYPNRAPVIPPPRPPAVDMGPGVTLPDRTPADIPPPKNVFIGVPTNANMTPAQRAAAKVEALQTADPQSKVRETAGGYEIDPPQKLSRLKAMGKGFLLRMLAGAPHGPGGMLGAGTVGAVEGAVAPGHVQSGIRQRDVARAQGEQATAQQLERGTITNQSAQVGLEAEQERLANLPRERERQQSQDKRVELQSELNDWEQQAARLDNVSNDDPARAGYIAALQKEAERLSAKAGRQITLIPGEGKEPLRMAVDGQIIERNKDGSWKSVFGSPKTDRTDENYDEKARYEWEVKNTENAAKRSSAEQAAKMAEETAAEHQKKVSAIAAQLSVLDEQMGAMGARDPKIGPLKRQREQLKQQQASEESAMNAAYKERNKAKAEASGVPVVPPPPRRARAASGKQALSKSAWTAAHPGGDWNAAQAEAQRRQLPIIP